jgi:hypothetical protein
MDAEHMSRVLPGKGEVVQQRLVWIGEAFGPMQIENLVNGLRRGNWDDAVGGRRPTDFVRRLRAGDFGWGWVPLGATVPPDDAVRMIPPSRRASLPDGVRWAAPSITTLPGSLTVLTVTFLLDDAAALAVDRALRTSYKTEIAAVAEREISFSTPENQQAEAVQAVRREMRDEHGGWVSSRFRGVFGSSPGGDLPAVELLTYRTAEATTWSPDHQWSHSLRLDGFPMWRSSVWPSLQMTEGDDDFGDGHALRLRGPRSDAEGSTCPTRRGRRGRSADRRSPRSPSPGALPSLPAPLRRCG